MYINVVIVNSNNKGMNYGYVARILDLILKILDKPLHRCHRKWIYYAAVVAMANYRKAT